MNRFEIAEAVMVKMDTIVDYQSPYAVSLRSALAAALDDAEAEPLVIEVSVEWPGVPNWSSENGWVVATPSGEAWLVIHEVDETETRAWPVIRRVRRSPRGYLRFKGQQQPTVSYTEPDPMTPRITYQWPNIRVFEDDERGIRDLFRSWVNE